MSDTIAQKSGANSFRFAKDTKKDFVSMQVDGQLFGIEVLAVHDVLKHITVSPIPLAPTEVYGLLNLRGRIVTTIDVRTRLGLDKADFLKPMCVVVEHKGEPYGLIVDSVGDVLQLYDADFETSPANLSPAWQASSLGVYMLEGKLLIVLDVTKLLSMGEDL
jgi:purine-binding chemotaxis protein CheW